MSTREITIDQCSSFYRCSAPLCPLDPLLKQCCWYPDDDVCRKSFPPQWIKTQRKISTRTKNMDTYYLFKMLNQDCIVGRGMVGIDPNRPEEEQLASWLKKHPKKRELNIKEKEDFRERIQKNIQNTKMNPSSVLVYST